MPVNAVETATTPVVGAPTRDYSQINQVDFMNLLVAQIQNQDPLSPMDNAQFTSQITQFTMLDELATMSARIEENVLMSQSINNTAMLALVGRDCTVAGDEVHVSDGVASGNKLNCTEPGTATIEVKDAEGKTVATYVRTVDTGLNDIGWDGLLANGDKADDGAYTISVRQVDASNQPVTTSDTLMTGAVQGLRYENGIAVVTVHGEEFYVSDIYQVS
jgi:flagellar basal-body rod modification protein FlgD